MTITLRAIRFVAERGLSGTNIEADDLRSLAVEMKLNPIEIAKVTGCYPELILRKAASWQLDIFPDWEANLARRSELLKSVKSKQTKSRSINTKEPQNTRAVHHAAHEKGVAFISTLSVDRQKAPTLEDLLYLYEELKLPSSLIAHLFGVSGTTMRSWMAMRSIKRRKGYESRGMHYNVTFFKAWTRELAWVLGLYFTDGHVSRNTLSISSIDTELVEKIRNLVSPAHTISVNKNNRDGKINQFAINSPEIVSLAKGYGLTERKSLTMQFPEVPDDCMRHFIRGCWDGDGGFSGTIAHYTCGSKMFIDSLAIVFFKAGIYRHILHRKAENYEQLIARFGNGPYPLTVYRRGESNAYDLRIGHLVSLKQLYDYLYKDVPPELYLARKKEKLLEILNRDKSGNKNPAEAGSVT